MYEIMIVEDEELIRQGLTSLVDYEQFGMTVTNQAENGREAWEKFQDRPADILLTDINMPQMNGLDLAHHVKEQSPSCHIIFLTGYDDFEFARKAIKLGADDYLLKPFSKDDIEEMLAKVKGKLDKERKKAQVEDLVSHGY
ncbi:MAG: response regulator, partial [Streptococcus parasanguinis]|nr:response regulator [Streptococcus parasanguinis]